jgi:cell division protease FtsH
VGLARVAQRQGGFAGTTQDGAFQRDCSEKTAQLVDDEVKRILDQTYHDAKDILSVHREQLDRVSAELLKEETLDAEAFRALLGRPARPAEEKPEVAPPHPVSQPA